MAIILNKSVSGVDPVSQSKAVSVRPTGLDDLYVLSRESDEMPTTQNSATAKRWGRVDRTSAETSGDFGSCGAGTCR